MILNDIKGIATNGGICRIDIFEKENKYYIIPIYIADIVKAQLPNLIIKSNQPRSTWDQLDDSYTFKFSLQKNDLIRLASKEKEYLGYFRKCPGNVASIYIDQHDISDSQRSIQLGITTLNVFEKYSVDILGSKYLVKVEKRRGLEKSHHNKSIQAIPKK